MRWLFLILFSINALCGFAQGKNIVVTNYRLSFTIQDTSVNTSAGIYDSTGCLVRTLWANQKYSKGTYQSTWDGKNDTGKLVSNPDKCSWQLTKSNLAVAWDGVIGNTSKYQSGSNIHKGLYYADALCFSGKTAFMGQLYNEGTSAMSRFNTDSPQVRTLIDNKGGTPDVNDCATDGNNVYWAGVDANSHIGKKYNTTSFIWATKVTGDSLVTFPSGTIYQKIYGHNYSAVSLVNDTSSELTSISVQKTGSFLFAARPKMNLIYVYNKTTGDLVRQISLQKVNKLRVDATGNYLWASYDDTVTEKYRINTDGTIATTHIILRSSQPIVALDVNSIAVIIAEGGTKQIIKAYNPSTGALLWTYGKEGGYLTNATVSDDKFYWNDARSSYNVCLSFQPDGSFWAGDPGNTRLQHFTYSRSPIGQIAWTGIKYGMNVDPNAPSRVFFDLVEYHVDYTKPLAGTNGSWALKYNWGGDVTAAEYNGYKGIANVVTFPNGKTFGFLNLTSATTQLVLLNDDGTKVRTGITSTNSYYIDPSGDLYRQDRSLPGQAMNWYVKRLVGYDSNGYPRWGTETKVEGLPVAGNNEPGYQGDPNHYHPNAFTSNHTYIGYSNTADNTAYHLSGIKNGRRLFLSALADWKYYAGKFPPADRFEIGNNVRNAGTSALTFDSLIIWGYNGEFYKGSQQTNVYSVVFQNGLPVAQFGALGDTSTTPNPPGFAGNALSMSVVKAKGTWYLYHNDESIHAGVQRWSFKNENTIRTLSGKLTPVRESLSADASDLLAGLPLTKGNFITANTAGWSFNPLLQKRSYGNSWVVSTQKFSLDNHQPDLSFSFGSQSISSATAQRDLTPLLPATIKNWKLSSVLNFAGYNTNNGSVQFYFDILDNAGKIIVRFYGTKFFGDKPALQFYANNKMIYTTNIANSEKVLTVNQPLVISVKGEQLSVSFGGQNAVDVSPYDASASPLHPALIRLTFNQAQTGNFYGLAVAIISSHFYSNQ